MHFSTSVLIAALSASASLAAPTYQSAPINQPADDSVVAILKPANGNKLYTAFQKVQLNQREELMTAADGPFSQVDLHVGKGAQKQDLRCQVIDQDGKAIVMTRGENVDITFSDADKGFWTFKTESKVKKVICDPAFEKAGSDAKDVTVILSGPSELKTQTVFKNFDSSKAQTGKPSSFGPYNKVELQVGALVAKQDLRCKIKDMHGKAVIITRGDNIDETFSDADKGAWAFKKPAEGNVHSIECDPAFVAKKVTVY